jgi:hypothetical protein
MTKAEFLIKYVLLRAPTVDELNMHSYNLTGDAERAWNEITRKTSANVGEQCFSCEEFIAAASTLRAGQIICPTCLSCSRHYSDLITVKIGG